VKSFYINQEAFDLKNKTGEKTTNFPSVLLSSVQTKEIRRNKYNIEK
jgi:hypothetical protein